MRLGPFPLLCADITWIFSRIFLSHRRMMLHSIEFCCIWFQFSSWLWFLVMAVDLAVADFLLWKRWCAAAVVLVSATSFWFLFERAGYNLLSFVANVVLLLVVILFLWAKSASILNRYFATIFHCLYFSFTLFSLKNFQYFLTPKIFILRTSGGLIRLMDWIYSRLSAYYPQGKKPLNP